jgi:CHAD domain-containing protein
VSAALNSERYLGLLDALDRVIADPPSGPDAGSAAGLVLPAAVGRAYRKTGRRMGSAEREPPGGGRDVALHQARKAAKQARYAAEVVAPVAGHAARRTSSRMKQLQSVLGDHQDTVVGRHLTRQLAIEAHQAGENAFSYGLFWARDACAARDIQAGAHEIWQQAARARHRRWMMAGS